jgi:hypothetical protein
MAPLEILYGRRCCTPLNWIELGEKVIFGPNIIDEAEATVYLRVMHIRGVKRHA